MACVFVSLKIFPVSLVSIVPRCSALSLNWFASDLKYLALSRGCKLAHDTSKAFCAALTALSTSFALASGTVAQTSLFSGFKVSIVLPVSESTHWPSMYILKFWIFVI